MPGLLRTILSDGNVRSGGLAAQALYGKSWRNSDDEQKALENALAVAKLQNLNEDLKTAQLQNMDFEAATGYRTQKRQLDTTLAQTQIARERSARNADELHGMLSRLQIAGEQTNQIEHAADRPLNKRRLAADTLKSETDAQRSQTAQRGDVVALGEKLAGLAGAGLHSSAIDARSLARYANPNGSEADITTLASILGNELSAVQDQYQGAIATRDANQAKVQSETRDNIARAMFQEVHSVVNLADAAAQNPEVLAGYEAALAPDDVAGRRVLAGAKALAGNRPSKEPDYVDKNLSDDLSKAYVTGLQNLQGAKASLQSLDSERLGYTSRSKEGKRRQTAVDNAQKALDDLRTQLEGLRKKNKPTKSATGIDALIESTTPEELLRRFGK